MLQATLRGGAQRLGELQRPWARATDAGAIFVLTFVRLSYARSALHLVIHDGTTIDWVGVGVMGSVGPDGPDGPVGLVARSPQTTNHQPAGLRRRLWQGGCTKRRSSVPNIPHTKAQESAVFFFGQLRGA